MESPDSEDFTKRVYQIVVEFIGTVVRYLFQIADEKRTALDHIVKLC